MIQAATGCQIGSTSSNNVISGNGLWGVYLTGAGTTGNVVFGSPAYPGCPGPYAQVSPVWDQYGVPVCRFDPSPMVSLLPDTKRYGVIVTNGFRRGLLLPDLEGVDTPEQQVSIAMQKAGIAPGEPIALERFRVDRFH